MSARQVDVAVIGAGIIGISVAYYLSAGHGIHNVALIDPRDPMSLTSAQSGENYRNWWPNPVMTAFTNHSIGLLEDIARQTGNRINMTRRGYALVTRRQNLSDLLDDLHRGYGAEAGRLIRVHEAGSSGDGYQRASSSKWENAPEGVDILLNKALIRETFPSYSDDVSAVLHVRRAGAISGQQLGQYMLERIRDLGGKLVRGQVTEIEKANGFALRVASASGTSTIKANQVVNAAGPFIGDVAKMLGHALDVSCVYQQKISFEDTAGAIPRNLPFTIDLDGQNLNWTDEEREMLLQDPQTRKLAEPMQGAIHVRPDGAEGGKWIKLGWAYNHSPSDPHGPEPIDPHFPDIVLRGASRLQPALATYIGRLPRGAHHYGGYYTMTDENWPLIGPVEAVPGAYIAGALSGYGTMAATAAGAICASWIAGRAVPDYALKLAPNRYDNPEIMAEINATAGRGHL